MGSSEGEAIAPDVEGAGGSRAYQGGDAGCAMPPRSRCRSRSGRRRERQLQTVRLIGQGSDALVYLVRCEVTGRRSALKVQRKADHERSAERVHMEREVMVDARHPLVAPLYAAFQDRLYLYLDMEYCPGGSLDNFVRYCLRRNLTEDEARFFAAEITLGLEFLHSKGYVYRDLKAANVLVAGSGHIKLTDFGIAERGKVKIETDDMRMGHEPLPSDPLPRTKSSPGLTQVVEAAAAPAAAAARPAISPRLLGSRCSRRKHPGRNASAAAAAGGIASPGHPSPSGASSSRKKDSNRRSSHPSFASTTAHGDARARAPKPSEGLEDSSAIVQTARDSELLMGAAAAGPTPPRPPTLGRRIRSKFRRGPRGPLSAGSIPPSALSVEPGAAEVVAGSTSSLRCAEQGGLTGGAQQQQQQQQQSSDSLGMPPPSPGRVGGPAPARGCAQKQDVSGPGFPPPDSAEETVAQDRCGSPKVNHLGQTSTRQTTVTLAESSWGLLSGSPEYMAPEVLLHDPQGSAVDWWGLGILTYELLLGQTPFAGENGKTRFTFLNIMHKDASFPGPGEREEGDVSAVCQRFIRALLSKDPRGRVGSRGAHAVKAHPFFSSVSWDQLLEQEPPLVPRRFGNECGVPPVHNTSGWWWDAEDAADLEADEAAAAAAQGLRGGGRKAGGRGGEGGGREEWWPFDRFTWSDGIGGDGLLFPAKFETPVRACSRGSIGATA